MELMRKSDIGDKLPLLGAAAGLPAARRNGRGCGAGHSFVVPHYVPHHRLGRSWTGPLQPPQNCFVASLAPSAIVASLAHTTSESTAAWPTQVPKPQSLPAMTLLRPTRLA